VYCDFLGVWPHSASTSCPVCKYDSSIDSARQGLLSSSSAARQDWFPLCCDARHTELQSVRHKTSHRSVVKNIMHVGPPCQKGIVYLQSQAKNGPFSCWALVLCCCCCCSKSTSTNCHALWTPYGAAAEVLFFVVDEAGGLTDITRASRCWLHHPRTAVRETQNLNWALPCHKDIVYLQHEISNHRPRTAPVLRWSVCLRFAVVVPVHAIAPSSRPCPGV
jgi:hypothetical protein